MFRKTSKVVGIAAAIAIALVFATAARASSIPSAFVNRTECITMNDGAQIYPSFTIYPANLYSNVQETQRLYVHIVLLSVWRNLWIGSQTFYGDATGYDVPTRPDFDQVSVWRNLSTGQAVTGPGTSFVNPFGWYAPELGQFRVYMQFAWGRSSSGALPSSAYFPANNGWTQLTAAPHDCIFNGS